MSFVWSSLLYCLFSVFPSLHSKRTHVILPLESDWIMLKIIVYKAKYKVLYNLLHYFHCSFDGWHLVPLWLEMEKAMIPLCYFSVSLCHQSSLSLCQFVSLRIERHFRFFIFWTVSISGRVLSVRLPLGSRPLGTTEMEWLKCSCPYLSLAVLSTLQPPECVARVQACMHVSVRSSLHLCVCREIR